MSKRESVRPQKSPAVVELERLVRQLGQPDQGLLDAASETMSSPAEPADLSTVPKFVEGAAEVCVAAHGRWRECTAEQRALLRGCSLDLISLAADQCLRLDRTFAEFRQSEVDVKDAGQNLAAALERAEALAEQARSVIQTVAGVPQQAPVAEVDDPAAAFAVVIRDLRDTARELLDRGSPGVRKRCALYALDESYVQMLEATLGELADLVRRASDAAAVARKKVQVERTFACARPLIDQLAQAFEHASRLDKNIAPVRAAEVKRPPADKPRGTVVMQKTAVMKLAPPEPARRVEKLVIGGADPRFKR
ncbi:MAG TPA: hypothetical protein VK745_02170 [Polyangiaceae bacterium]|nr:hypothetical protein [Polyangiaceae bacterium]